MTPSKWITSAFILMLILGGAAVYFFRSPTPRSPLPGLEPAAVQSVSPEVEAFRRAPVFTRVQSFYETESKRIGAIDPDPKLTEERLRSVAAELKPEEIHWLLNTALNAKENGDGRFFATYLLALGRSPEAMDGLRAIALTEILPQKNKAKEELERQIRAQATEGLGRGCDIANARDALLDVVEMQLDEFIRDRAHRALNQCRTGKSVEAQDKEALEKVMEGKSR